MLSNELISLRPIERADLPFLRDLAADPEVRSNVVGWDWPASLAAQERWFDVGIDTDSTRRFLIETVADESPIGVTGFWNIDWRNRTAMSAIKVGGAAEVRGQGFGQQAIQLMTEFAFHDVGFHRLYAQILEYNAASLALYIDKCGWTREGVTRQDVWRRGQYWDTIHVGILRTEFLDRAPQGRS